jgi:hypothetical protein
MNPGHRKALEEAIRCGKRHLAERNYDLAMRELETAHVLGQMKIRPHLYVHWLMLRVELGRAALGAALGQLARIALGALGHALGRLPVGNTGGSNVSMFKPMPIDPALEALMRGDS